MDVRTLVDFTLLLTCLHHCILILYTLQQPLCMRPKEEKAVQRSSSVAQFLSSMCTRPPQEGVGICIPCACSASCWWSLNCWRTRAERPQGKRMKYWFSVHSHLSLKLRIFVVFSAHRHPPVAKKLEGRKQSIMRRLGSFFAPASRDDAEDSHDGECFFLISVCLMVVAFSFSVRALFWFAILTQFNNCVHLHLTLFTKPKHLLLQEFLQTSNLPRPTASATLPLRC